MRVILRTPALVLLSLLSFADLLAAGRELGPRGGGPTSYGVRHAVTGYAGGRFLTIWREHMGHIGSPLMAALSDAEGRRLSPTSFPIGIPGEPAHIAGMEDGFAVFSSRGQLTEVNLDGRVTRTRATALPPFSSMRAEWNGSRFLVAMLREASTGYTAEAMLLDRDGNAIHRPPIERGLATGVAIVPDPDGFTLIVTSFHGVFGYRLTNDGEESEFRIAEPSGILLPWSPVAAATAGSDVLVVWASSMSRHSQLESAVVTREGEVRDARVLAQFEVSALHPLALVRSGNTHVVAYRKEQSTIETLLLGAAAPATLVTGVLDASAAASEHAIFVAYTPSTIFPLRIQSVATTGVQDIVSFSRTRQTQPALAAGGGRFLAAWTDIAGEAAFVRAASLGLDGEPLTDRIVAPAYLAARELAWNGSEYLAVERRNTTLLATRVAYDGTPIDPEPIVLTEAQWSTVATVAWSGDRWLVLWAEYDRLRFVTVSRAGVASAPGVIALTSSLPTGLARDLTAVAVAANGTTTLVAWTEEQWPPCFFPPCRGAVAARTVVARLRNDGQLLDAAPLELPAATTLAVATSGREFLVLADTTAHAVDATDAPRLVASRRLLEWKAMGDVTWDGSSYAVALRYHGLNWHLSVTHLDRTAAPIGAPVGTTTLAPDVLEPPSIAAILPSSALVALQEGDAQDGTRAVVYSERAMMPLPAPPSPPRNVRIMAANGGYEVTWDAPATGDVELYWVEGLTYGGAWAWVGIVPATQPLRIRSPFATVRVRAFNAGGASEFTEPPSRRRTARP